MSRPLRFAPTGEPPSLQRLSALPGHTRVCCGHEYTLANAAFARAVEPGNARLAARSAEAARQRAAGEPTLPSTIASERECNPFLRCDAPEVRASIGQRLGHAPADAVEVFGADGNLSDFGQHEFFSHFAFSSVGLLVVLREDGHREDDDQERGDSFQLHFANPPW